VIDLAGESAARGLGGALPCTVLARLHGHGVTPQQTTAPPMNEATHVMPSAAPATTFEHPRPQQPLRILVVDDNELNLLVASAQLAELGYEVETARDGQEAVQSLQQHVFTAVLMDCEMPVMDGFAATRQIRRRELAVGGRLPIIALTAHDDDATRARALDADMDGLLQKPLLEDELKAVLDDIVRRAAQLAAAGAAVAEPDDELASGITRYADVMLLFLELVPAQIAAIDDALAAGDLADARAYVHKLKGGALSLGARGLAATASALESTLSAGAKFDAGSAVAGLRVQFARVRPLLEREIHARTTARPETEPS
jgi:CheY-like chemotaxis protein